MVGTQQFSMKIAVFTDVFLRVPGGIPSSIKAQKKALEARGDTVVIFCPGYAKPKDIANVEVVPTHRILRFGGAPLSKRPGKVVRWIERNYNNSEFDFDVVHVHYEASCSIAGILLARKNNIPLVQTMHGREDMAAQVNVPHPFKFLAAAALCFLHGRYIPHEKKVRRDTYLAPTLTRAKMWEIMVAQANSADRVVTPSRHFRDKLLNYGVYRPIFPVSNGVADGLVSEFDAEAKKKGVDLVRVKADDMPLRIFWNSRLSKEKRIMPFLKVLNTIKEPYEFTACGDGNQLGRARRYIKRHHLNARILGRVPHEKMLSLMLKQHLSVTVSDGFDTQGLTLLEAEATGLPVFFCDPDMKESVPKGGYVMSRSGSVADMAKALDALCRNSEKISEMSRVMLSKRAEVLQSTQIVGLYKVYDFRKQTEQ